MKSVLLIGLGKFGIMIAEELNKLGHQIMGVDKDEEKVNSALPLVTNAVIGDCTKREVIKSLGANNFDSCIVAIGDNFQNSLETTALLKEMGAKKVISRACNDIHEKFLLRNGADEVIYPERQLARWTAVRSTRDTILDYIEIDDRYSIFEMRVPPEWEGKTILELDVRRKYSFNILGVKEEDGMNMNITPDRVLHTGQSIMLLGNMKNIQKCFKI